MSRFGETVLAVGAFIVVIALYALPLIVAWAVWQKLDSPWNAIVLITAFVCMTWIAVAVLSRKDER